MSVRTLVEINNDKLEDIKSNPKEFVKRLIAAIEEGGLSLNEINSDDGCSGDTHRRLWSVER